MSAAGDIIAGRYRLESVLGEGGLGVVWRATRLDGVSAVALKLLKDNDEEARNRFAKEATALLRLHHPGCVTILDFGELDDGTPFLVTELLHGQPLDARPPGPLAVPDALRIAIDIADAVHYAHAQGVTHRDLKPANVFLTDGGLKVLDFGLAKLAREEGPALTETGMMFGTPHYISPEQVRDTRNAGPPTDQYALGVLLFELVSGRLPFQGHSLMQICMAHLTEPPPPLNRPDCPPTLHAIIYRLLQKDPQHRFPNFDALRSALQTVEIAPTATIAELRPRLLATENSAAAATTIPHRRKVRHAPAPRADAPRPAARLLFPAAAAAVVAVIAAVALYVRADQPNDEPPRRVLVPPAPSPAPAPPPTETDPAEPPPPAALSPVELPAAAVAPARASEGCGTTQAGDVIELTVRTKKGARDVTVWLPTHYDASAPAPSLTLFTYRRRPVDEYAHRARIRRPAVHEGFVVIGLHALDRDFVPPKTDVDALKGWEAQAPPHVVPWEEDDDVEFVHRALDHVGKRLCLDVNRAVALGHAEGAQMIQRLACEDDFPFQAVALTGWALRPDSSCRMTRPVPTLRVAGADDTFVPFSGGLACDDKPYLSGADTDLAWASALECERDVAQRPWSTDLRCNVADCDLGAYVTCVVDGGHYLADSHYNRRGATLVKNITTAFGDKPPSWFDPPQCGPTPILDLEFELTILPFLRHYVRPEHSE